MSMKKGLTALSILCVVHSGCLTYQLPGMDQFGQHKEDSNAMAFTNDGSFLSLSETEHTKAASVDADVLMVFSPHAAFLGSVAPFCSML